MYTYESVKQKNIRQLVILLLFVLFLPIFIYAVGKVQELRKFAAGSNEVSVKFSPSAGTFAQGSSVTTKLVVYELAQRAINVSGAQAVFNVSDKFTIVGISCDAPFNGLPFSKVEGNQVTVMCAIGLTASTVPVTAAELPFATLQLTVLDTAADGSAPITFASTRVTEAGVPNQAPDVSTVGEAADFTIGAGGNLSPTPIESLTPTPTTSAYGEFDVPIGGRDQISVNIGPGVGNEPQITFAAALSMTQNNPDMYFRLRVNDELYFRDYPDIALNPTCDTPSAAERDFYIPMRAQGNVYRPVTSINVPAPPGIVANVDASGWITLIGVVPDRYYSLILKAPKFRGELMTEHVQLAAGQTYSQSFDFTGTPLQPGDLPDPNNSMMQDCTVNAIDLSLIAARIGSTQTLDLDIADVNFDYIVNGNDIAKVVNTLSTKPDDDL